MAHVNRAALRFPLPAETNTINPFLFSKNLRNTISLALALVRSRKSSHLKGFALRVLSKASPSIITISSGEYFGSSAILGLLTEGSCVSILLGMLPFQLG